MPKEDAIPNTFFNIYGIFSILKSRHTYIINKKVIENYMYLAQN